MPSSARHIEKQVIPVHTKIYLKWQLFKFYWACSIWSDVMFDLFVLVLYVASLVAINKYIHDIARSDLPFGTSITFVLGFLLAFRTNTAYERFSEGRRAWAQIVNTSKSLGRLIANQVKIPSNPDRAKEVSKEVLQSEKFEAMKQVVLFARSSMHHIRTVYQSRREQMSVAGMHVTNLLRAKSHDGTIDLTSIGSSEYVDTSIQFNEGFFRITPSDERKNPLEHLDNLSRFFAKQVRIESVQGSIGNSADMNMCTALSEGLHICLRIVRTPLPYAYTIHLSHILIVYCSTLPFGILRAFEWYTILVCGIIYFVYLGLYRISFQLENPFGNDPNDLPIELFCHDIEQEITRIARNMNEVI